MTWIIKEFDFTGIPQEDIDFLSKELLSKIDYIRSGRREKDLLAKKLDDELLKWSKEFYIELENLYGLTISSASFSDFEITIGYCSIFIPFRNKNRFDLKEDFVVNVKSYDFNIIGSAKTPKDIVDIVNKYNEERGFAYQVKKLIKSNG